MRSRIDRLVSHTVSDFYYIIIGVVIEIGTCANFTN